jgi:hypothetical protein
MKPKKLLVSKNLSGPDGVKDVAFGEASPERRANREYGKEPSPKVNVDSLDDHTERMARWSKGFGLM